VESRVRENLTHGSGGGVRKHVAHCDGAPHAYLTTPERLLSLCAGEDHSTIWDLWAAPSGALPLSGE